SAQNLSAQSVDVVDAAAIVHVIPEDRADFAVDSTAGPRLAAPAARVENGRLIIDGRVRVVDCGSGMWGGNARSVRAPGVGAVREHDLPVVTIHTPRTVDLSTRGGVYADIAASSGGHVLFNGCGDIRVGPASGDLDLSIRGSGDVDLGSVS